MSGDSRYARQIQLDKIGAHGQSILAGSRVVIVGIGGLGCTVATQLAGAGIGYIRVIDHDVVDITNLHRQALFREADAGAYKAEVAKRELEALNSSIQIDAHACRLSPANVFALCNDADLLIDAADNFAVSYLLSDASEQLDPPLISASINQTFGYIGLFGNSAPSLRAVFPRLPHVQTSCETAGVTGPGVGLIASLQAQEAIKYLVGAATLTGKLLYLDVWHYQQHIIDFSSAVNTSGSAFTLVQAADLMPSDHIIDVRNPDEVIAMPQSCHVDQCVPLTDILTAATTLPDTRVVFVCRSGQRAMLAAQAALDQGHSKVAALLPDC